MSLILVQVIVGGLLLGAVYALFSSGLTLIWGMMNIVNFAHGDFVMLGMYVAFMVWTLLGVGPFVGAPVAALVLGLMVSSAKKPTELPSEKRESQFRLQWEMLLRHWSCYVVPANALREESCQAGSMCWQTACPLISTSRVGRSSFLDLTNCRLGHFGCLIRGLKQST